MAYVGSPRRNSVGGICTPEYFKNGYTLYLNSGLSSSRNHYGQRVITREADLVTAHEFGHNWGSEHDPDSNECSPSASQVRFLEILIFSKFIIDITGWFLFNVHLLRVRLRRQQQKVFPVQPPIYPQSPFGQILALLHRTRGKFLRKFARRR